jgi:hypothetical protein
MVAMTEQYMRKHLTNAPIMVLRNLAQYQKETLQGKVAKEMLSEYYKVTPQATFIAYCVSSKQNVI